MKTAMKRVPSPLETPVHVVVSGRTSTLKRIRVVRTGNAIPVTFSRDRMTNTAGFAWHVSRHYALKTDFPDARARELLTLLELAYPHYVALFGREIPGIDEKRMACIYGSSMETLQVAMRDDAMFVFGGGGIAQEGFWACYQVASNEYHSRYILIHECVHLYQYCLTKTTTNTCLSFIEGIADRLSSHVYEPQRQRLTVNVLDRAPVHNFLEYGCNHVRKNRKLGFTEFVQGGDRGLNVLVTTFLQRDPESQQKWRIYRDEMFRTAVPATKQQTAERLIRRLYGNPATVWAAFRAWARTVRPTFFQTAWGFDQYGDTLISFGTPGAQRFSQMNIDLVPGRKPQAAPFRLDYPAESMPAIVGPVRRGVDEPAIGCVVDFSRANGSGLAGRGLGREGHKHFRVLLDGGARLVIDGTDWRGAKRTWALPSTVRTAMHADNERAGLTVTVASDRLVVTVRAGKAEIREFCASMRLGRGLRQRLMSEPLAVLGGGARHLITPFFDDGRLSAPDLNVPAAPNLWRNAADDQLFAVYRACWRLGRSAPPVLRVLRRQLLPAAGQDAAAQREAAAAFGQQLPAIVTAIRTCGAEAGCKAQVLAELSGASIELILKDGRRPGWLEARARLRGPVVGCVKGSVRIGPCSVVSRAVSLQPGTTQEVVAKMPRAMLRTPLAVQAEARLRWFRATFPLRAARVADAAFPCGWQIGPFDNEGQVQDKEHLIEKTPVELTRVYFGQTGTLVPWRRFERDPDLPVDAENLLYFNRLFSQQANYAFAYVVAWVQATREQDAVLAVGAADGLVAWVNAEKVHVKLGRRDWAPREDRIFIHLRKGANRILLKSVHGTGLWFLSPHLEDHDGSPPAGTMFLPNPPAEAE